MFKITYGTRVNMNVEYFGTLNSYDDADIEIEAWGNGFVSARLPGTGATLHMQGQFNLDTEATFAASTITSFEVRNSADVVLIGVEGLNHVTVAEFTTDAYEATLRAEMLNSPLTIIGSRFGDVLFGTDFDDHVEGNAGADRIDTYDGDDYIWSGDGADRVDAGAGDDNVGGGTGRDSLRGGDGNDDLSGHEGSDWLAGGAGNDEMDGGSGRDALWANFGNDVLIGGEDGDFLAGGLGHDTLEGGSGNDRMYAGHGDDHLDGGSGDDRMYGGLGDDVYVVDSAGDIITEGQFTGVDTVQSSVSYTLPAYIEHLELTQISLADGTGNALDNDISGNSNDNVLSGLAGDDFIAGGNGDDSLYGGEGTDILDGGLGNNLLDGGPGADILLGTSGNNHFVYDPDDTLYDGGVGLDTLVLPGANEVLDLSALADGLLNGIDAFDLTGTGDNTLILDLASVLDLDAGVRTFVVGDAGDSVHLPAAEFTLDPESPVDIEIRNGAPHSGTYNAYDAVGGHTILVEPDITVVLV